MNHLKNERREKGKKKKRRKKRKEMGGSCYNIDIQLNSQYHVRVSGSVCFKEAVKIILT